MNDRKHNLLHCRRAHQRAHRTLQFKRPAAPAPSKLLRWCVVAITVDDDSPKSPSAPAPPTPQNNAVTVSSVIVIGALPPPNSTRIFSFRIETKHALVFKEVRGGDG